MDLKALTEDVVAISMRIGAYQKKEQLRFSQKQVEVKGFNDFVSYVDKNSEQMFASELTKLFSKAGFIGEENSSGNQSKEFNWIVDPLDGTTNFVHGLPAFCTSTALVNEDDLLLGVICDPNLDECFYAYQNGGSYLNGDSIRVSKTENLKSSLLATGFPYNDFGKAEEYLHVFKAFMNSTRGIRRIGSAAIDLAYVACGRFDGFYEYGLNPWDVSAGAILVSEAGGVVTDFNGTSKYVENKTLVASNQKISSSMLKIIGRHFK